MSTWETRFNDHPFNKTFSDLEAFLKTDGLAGEDTKNLSSIARINEGWIYIHQQLKISNKTLVSRESLDALNNHISKVQGELSAFHNSKTFQHLTNANTNLDAATRLVFLFPKILINENFEELSKPLEEYRNLAEQFLDDISTKKIALDNDIEQLGSNTQENNNEIERQTKLIEEQKTQLSTLITEWQKQFSKAESSRTEAFNAQNQKFSDSKTTILDELNKDSKTLIDATTKIFSHLEKETTKTIADKTKQADIIFNEKMEKVDTETKDLTDKVKSVYDDSLSDIEKKSEEGLIFLEEKKKEASNLLEVISTTSLTGHYKRIANEEGKKANFWRNAAMSVMGLIGVIIVVIAWNTKGVSWEDTLFRMTAAFILFFPASYAKSESNKHRKNEQRNRRLELELAAFDPYLDKLPDTDKIEIKKGFVGQFFGSTNTDKTEETLPQKELLNIIKTAIQNLTK